MDKRSIVINSIKHKKTECVPYYAEFTLNEKARLIDYYNDKNFYEKFNVFLEMGVYGWFHEVKDKPDFFKDEFGVIWNRSGVDKDIGVIERPLIQDLSDYSYRFPEPDEKRFRDRLRMLEQNKDVFTIAGIGFALFERAWSLLSIPETLISMIANPIELEELLDQICEFDLKLVDIALDYDIDCIHFGDDWGQQRGLIMGAPHWRRFIKPRMKRLYERVKKAGKFVSQHSCGDVHEIFPDLIEIGLDIYQTFQPEIYKFEQIKKQYGQDLTFWGGISTQQLLPYATPEEVKRETARIMSIMSRNGGYIAAPTHAVPGDVPAENIEAMFEVFMNQEKYNI